eukprot:CAMPEP_0170277110 /NCGR_PEP_ID=MMETSP0116_2-20130129/38543_1 /TAXON_ID=400756 /ORGANISM="Durinskia baltica, Strain CSIRO CS-38" /LENGTH=82 /DNA_ID=CAMNT_0010528389 /DNA_START=144 /DNA_END=390 /DNA_ORIENTATION=+
MKALHFSSPWFMMHSSRAAFVWGHAQQILHVGFFAGAAAAAGACSFPPPAPMDADPRAAARGRGSAAENSDGRGGWWDGARL